jgi:hypothetical protein
MIEIFGGEVGRLLGVIDRILADGREHLAGRTRSATSCTTPGCASRST